MTTNHKVLEQIVDMLGRPICYAGGELSKSNPATLHHAGVQVKDGGSTDIYNCCIVAHLEHNATHIVGDHNSYRRKDIHDYYMDRIEEALTYGSLSREALVQFNAWLQAECNKLGLRPHRTKDNLLIYKRK